MNNQELFNLFQSIQKQSNCFDRAIALKNAKKAYKKSNFYKTTHYPITKAYSIFMFNSIEVLIKILNSDIINELSSGNFVALQKRLEVFIEDFDVSVLDDIFDYITNKINNLEIDNSNLQIKLDNIVQEFQKSLR